VPLADRPDRRLLHELRPVEIRNPCPRLTAWCFRASRLISVKTLAPKGLSRVETNGSVGAVEGILEA